MPRRIEIELTSRTGDGAFTWRAAGARQPKGTVATELLPVGVAVGDVVRAEVETGLEGLEIVAVLPRQEKTDERPSSRIEVLGTPRRGPDVVVSYASGRPRRDDAERDGRRGAGPQGRGPRASRPPGEAPTEPRRSRPPRERPERGTSARSRPRTDERRERTDERRERMDDRRERSDERRERTDERRERTDERRERTDERRERQVRDGATRDGATRDGATANGRSEHGARGPRRPLERPGDSLATRRERRPAVSTAHRNAMLAALGPQELPIAEQLLRGGIPAVRQALAEQYRSRPADIAAEANRDAVLSLAEQLLPRVTLASWKDRAASAQVAGKELRLRELRAVVTAARTVTLDDEARTIARALHESLDQRVKALREEWVGRMTKALDDGRATDAVRVSARTPEPAARLPAELAVRLAEAAGQAMTTETAVPEWIALLDAVVLSPVRRNVKPRGIPADEQAKDAARRAAGHVPELAKLLGLRIPPPPPRRPLPGQRVMAGGGAGPAGGR